MIRNNHARSLESYNTNVEVEKIAPQTKTSRLYSLDILRGLSVVLMGFIHSREFAGVENYSNLDWNVPAQWEGTNTLDFIQQAFMTSIGASGFFMLMGAGLILFYRARLNSGWTINKITYHLALRGLILILVQMTFLQAFEMYTRHELSIIYVGVLAALGGCMIISSAVIFIMHHIHLHTKTRAVFYYLPLLVVGLIIYLVHYTIYQIQHDAALITSWKVLFLLSGHYPLPSGFDLDVNFTALPWMPIVAIGMVMGQTIQDYPRKIPLLLASFGLFFLMAWLFIRTGNIFHFFQFGEFKLSPTTPGVDLKAYFCMSKYPPSMSLILWSVGINFLVISLLYRAETQLARFYPYIKPLIIFGQCSLLFFILHWFIYYGWSLLLPTPIYSFFGLVLFAMLGVITLYPICKSYRSFKRTLPEESVLRLF